MITKIKTFFKNYLIVLLIGICLPSALRAQTKVEAKLQDYTIKIGDQTKLFLVVEQSAKEQVTFPVLTETITANIQIVAINKPDTVVDKTNADHITVTQSIVITSFEPGTQTLPSFKFSTSSGILNTNSLTLQVQTVKVDTSKAIYDIKQPMAVTYTFVDWLRDNWIWVALGVGAIALIVCITYYIRNKPKGAPIIKKAEPAIPAHILAVDKLNELKAKKLWQQDQFKQSHTELTDIIREYLEHRYDIKTHEKTTEEILASLKDQHIGAEYLEVLHQILSLADLAKFAKFNPLPHENEGSMDNAIAFVLKTKQDNMASVNPQTDGGSGHEAV